MLFFFSFFNPRVIWRSLTSPGTAGYGWSALHGRDESWLEVEQVAGEVWHAVDEMQSQEVITIQSTTVKGIMRNVCRE